MLYMGVLNLKSVTSLADFYRLYERHLSFQFEKEKTYFIIAKTKTSLIRFLLPEWGFPLKLEGNLSPAETMKGLQFMEKIPIYQTAHALEVQERVFDKFGDRVSPASRRVYRSSLRKMITWGQAQDWWQHSVTTSDDSKAPTMLIFKKRVEHWHKLKLEELSIGLSQELDRFSTYLKTLRQPCLNESSCIRFYREVLGILGWLHRVKGVSLAELTLTKLVPTESIHNATVANQVAAQAEEYIEWMRSNLGGKESTLKFALRAFFLIAEYIHHEYAKK